MDPEAPPQARRGFASGQARQYLFDFILGQSPATGAPISPPRSSASRTRERIRSASLSSASQIVSSEQTDGFGFEKKMDRGAEKLFTLFECHRVLVVIARNRRVE